MENARRVFNGSIEVESQVSSPRQNGNVSLETLLTTKTLRADDAGFHYLIASGAQDIFLPDCTGTGDEELYGSWNIVIYSDEASTADITVKLNGETDEFQTISPGDMYKFINISKSTVAGSWRVAKLHVPETVPAIRTVMTHNATTDWADGTTSYDLSYDSATHGLVADDFIIKTMKLSGTNYEAVFPYVDYTDTDDINVKVSRTPDGRYEGRVIIMGCNFYIEAFTPLVTVPQEPPAEGEPPETTIYPTLQAYPVTEATLVHVSSDWEVYSDAEMTNLIHSNYNDTVNKTEYTIPVPLDPGTLYYWRVRFELVRI